MRKITSFILGLMIVLPLSATTHYTRDGKAYSYSGDAVSAININFADWDIAEFPATLANEMDLLEIEKDGQFYGFMKWKMQNQTWGGYNQNVLWNNNAADFGGSPNNLETDFPPTICFPAVVRGIDSIVVEATGQHWQKVTWVVGETSQNKNVNLQAGRNVIPIGSTDATFLYMQFVQGGNVIARIASIDFYIKAPDDPTSLDNANANANAIKVIENGQLVIIKNGVRYNVLGSKF